MLSYERSWLYPYALGRRNFDVGATQPRCWGDTTPMLGRRNFGWGDIIWGDKAMGRHNLHSTIFTLLNVHTCDVRSHDQNRSVYDG